MLPQAVFADVGETLTVETGFCEGVLESVSVVAVCALSVDGLVIFAGVSEIELRLEVATLDFEIVSVLRL